jgi:hypothetical protein
MSSSPDIGQRQPDAGFQRDAAPRRGGRRRGRIKPRVQTIRQRLRRKRAILSISEIQVPHQLLLRPLDGPVGEHRPRAGVRLPVVHRRRRLLRLEAGRSPQAARPGQEVPLQGRVLGDGRAPPGGEPRRRRQVERGRGGSGVGGGAHVVRGLERVQRPQRSDRLQRAVLLQRGVAPRRPSTDLGDPFDGLPPPLLAGTLDRDLHQFEHHGDRRRHLRVVVSVRVEPLGAAALEELQHELGALGDVGSPLRTSGRLQGPQELAQQVSDQRVGRLLGHLRRQLHRQHRRVDRGALLPQHRQQLQRQQCESFFFLFVQSAKFWQSLKTE